MPAGTGSDLARGLGLAVRPIEALSQVLAAEPRPIDAIEVTVDDGERRFSVNVTSTGVSGAVVHEVNANPRSGKMSYLAGTVKALWRYEEVKACLQVDGEELYDGPFFIAAVANGPSFGRGMKVAPQAAMDDGLLDVVVVAELPRWQMPWRLPQFLAGKHLGWDAVRWTRGREVRLEPHGELPPLEIDGELMASGPTTFRVLRGALRVLA